jgi:LPXTG-site transpeptidase (sortase) family protein
MKRFINLISNLSILLGVVLMALPVAYLVAVNTPQIWYRINPAAVEEEIAILTRDPFAETFGSITFVPRAFAEATEPNPDLPKKNTLRINGIDVDTPILEGNNEHEILNKGVWRLPSYGTPTNNDKPIILAAHRWGPVYISSEYRSKNMFINLPNLKAGDKIEIIWNQRKYTYAVKKVETTPTVTQLADLTLITCKYFNDPARIMVYADRVS